MPPSRPGWLPELPSYLMPVALIAEGVYGKVVRAEDTRRGRAVAVRVLEEAASGPSKVSRLEAANRLSTIDHPHLAAIYEVDTYHESSYIELELVEGTSLAQRLVLQPAIAFPEVVLLGRQLAAGLDAAHAVGVVHGDLNPENVLFNDQGVPKIIDFRFLVGETSAYVPDKSGMPPRYLSPEYVLDAPLEPTADVYSLGAILHQALTGRLPFDSIGDLAESSAGNPSTIRTLPEAPDGVPRVPQALADVVLKCVAKRASARYQSARELFGALEGLEYVPLPAAPAQARERTTLTDTRAASAGRKVAPLRPPMPLGRRLGTAFFGLAGAASAAVAGLMFLGKMPIPSMPKVGRETLSSEVVISVASEPEGALVYFRGGAVLGRAPTELPVPRAEGTRQLVVRFPSGEERVVALQPSRPLSIRVEADTAAGAEPE